jgi:hypothetical protein
MSGPTELNLILADRLKERSARLRESFEELHQLTGGSDSRFRQIDQHFAAIERELDGIVATPGGLLSVDPVRPGLAAVSRHSRPRPGFGGTGGT